MSSSEKTKFISNKKFTIRAFLTQALALPIQVLSMAVLFWLYDSRQFSITSQHASFAIIASAAFFLALNCFGWILGEIMEVCLESIKKTAETNNRLLVASKLPFRLVEFDSTKEHVERLVTIASEETRRLTVELKTADAREQASRQQVTELSALYASLSSIYKNSIEGVLAIDGDGYVVSCNQRAIDLLGLTFRDELIGASLSTAKSEHPWFGDLTEALSWARKNSFALEHSSSQRRFSKPFEGSILQMHISVWKVPNLRKSVSSMKHNEEVIICAYLQQTPDDRDFLLDITSPSPYELIGAHIEGLFEQLGDQYDAVKDFTTEVRSALKAGDTEGAHDALNEIERIGTQTSLTIKTFNKAISLPHERDKSLEQWVALEEVLTHANVVTCKALAINTAPPIVVDETTLSIPSELQQEKKISSVPPEGIFVKLPKTEANRIAGYLLSFLYKIGAHEKGLHLSLAYEYVSKNVSFVLPGSRPGLFCRVCAKFSGSPISAALVSSKFQTIETILHLASKPEAILSFLNIELKRHGGFMSVQGGTQKGTTVTLYLPVEESYSEQSSKNEAVKNQPVPENPFQALVVSSLTPPPKLIKALAELSIAPALQSAENLIELFKQSVVPGGLGFSLDTHSDILEPALKMEDGFDFDQFQCIIGVVNSAEDRETISALIAQHLGLPILILGKEDSIPDALKARSLVIDPASDTSVLIEAIEDLLPHISRTETL